jgi:hypothetical protein
LAEVQQEGEDALIAQQATSATVASTAANAAPAHDAVPQARVTTSLQAKQTKKSFDVMKTLG